MSVSTARRPCRRVSRRVDRRRPGATGALRFAERIAASAPLALTSIRATMRAGLADAVAAATAHELDQQTRLQVTADFREGIAAAAQRRVPSFTGR